MTIYKPRGFLALLFVAQLDTSLCYRSYQKYIPNGDKVPNPCSPGELWPGVGHLSPDGGGPRNIFGLMRNENWTEICHQDPDQDGRTNGEELGDPGCTWSLGQPDPDGQLSHPGVCEPIHDPKCVAVNSRLIGCPGNVEQKCNETNAADIETGDIRLSGKAVPAMDTTYMCHIYDIPFNDTMTLDLIAAEAIVGNKDVLHHMVLFGCTDDAESNSEFECFMTDKTKCRVMITAFAAWNTKVDFCLPPHVGVRLGDGGYKKLMIQYHWTNVELREGLKDSSGIKLYTTPHLREYNAGMLMIGQSYLEIPPGDSSVSFSGGCVSDCSAHRIKAPVKVIDVFHHMHYLGREQKVEVFRDGKKVYTLSDQKHFDYNIPKFYKVNQTVELLPGDEIKTTCTFNAGGKKTTTFFGFGTYDEMCFAFIRFYPLRNLPLNVGGCSQYKSVPLCKVFNADKNYVIDGCNVQSFLIGRLPEVLLLHAKVKQYCRLNQPCQPECRKIREKVLSHPCFQNDIGDLIREFVYTQKNETLMFLAALDTCASETCPTGNDTCKSNISPASQPVIFPQLLVLLSTVMLTSFSFQ